MAHNVLLDYPDINEEFKIHTNASDLQLGTVISHNEKKSLFMVKNLLGPS